MNIPAHIEGFWQVFVASRPVDPTPQFFEAFRFDANEAGADELAAWVLAGTQRATAGLVCSYEHASMPMPRAGDLSVVTNWKTLRGCAVKGR